MSSSNLLSPVAFKPNKELVLNLKMRRRLGEFKASDEQILDALRKSNNVGRKAIGILKGEAAIVRHRKGDSTVGLASIYSFWSYKHGLIQFFLSMIDTMAANICQVTPRGSLNAGDMRVMVENIKEEQEDEKKYSKKAESKKWKFAIHFKLYQQKNQNI